MGVTAGSRAPRGGKAISRSACEVSCRARRGFAAAISAVRPEGGSPVLIEEVRPPTMLSGDRPGADGPMAPPGSAWAPSVGEGAPRRRARGAAAGDRHVRAIARELPPIV